MGGGVNDWLTLAAVLVGFWMLGSLGKRAEQRRVRRRAIKAARRAAKAAAKQTGTPESGAAFSATEKILRDALKGRSRPNIPDPPEVSRTASRGGEQASPNVMGPAAERIAELEAELALRKATSLSEAARHSEAIAKLVSIHKRTYFAVIIAT
jgi:hypothetical protein